MKPQLPLVLLLLLGTALFSYSLTLPVFTNQAAADKLLANWENIGKVEYYKGEARLRTDKLTLMNVGSGIMVASLTVLSFMYVSGIKYFNDFFRLQTLRKTTVFIVANLSWLLMIPGTWWYYAFRLSRGDYPPFADSVGIPMAAQIPVFLWFLLPLNIFLLATTIKSTLPTLLFVKPLKYSIIKAIWEIFFGVYLLMDALMLGSFVVDGDHFSIVVMLSFSYILLCLRAGKISPAVAAQSRIVF